VKRQPIVLAFVDAAAGVPSVTRVAARQTGPDGSHFRVTIAGDRRQAITQLEARLRLMPKLPFDYDIVRAEHDEADPRGYATVYST
jgi:hypothetical protein